MINTYYRKDDVKKIVFIRRIDLTFYEDDIKEVLSQAYDQMIEFAKSNNYQIVDITDWDYKDEEDLDRLVREYPSSRRRR